MEICELTGRAKDFSRSILGMSIPISWHSSEIISFMIMKNPRPIFGAHDSLKLIIHGFGKTHKQKKRAAI